MAVGKPIIACVNGEGARLVCEADAGLAVAAEDGPGLAAAILRLYHEPADELNRLGSNAQRYYQANFDQDKLADQLIGHLNSVMKGTK
jgi:glycosyltransferase involved in cell wall biosynthesis